MNDKENVAYVYICTYIHTGILFSLTKEGNPAIYNNMNEPGEQYAKWIESDREKQISYNLTYTCNPKKIVKLIVPENFIIRWISSGDLMYSMVSIINNTVLYIWNLLRQ